MLTYISEVYKRAQPVPVSTLRCIDSVTFSQKKLQGALAVRPLANPSRLLTGHAMLHALAEE